MQKFYWGNSTSSMQTEGGWNEDGKSLSVYDIRPAGKEQSDWHFANDNYHHLDEDLDLMQDLGMNMYRFQISWSRVIVDGDGEINPKGLDYYDRLVDGLKKRHIEPMICLYHFDMPLKLAKEGGFLSKKVTENFIRYGKKMVDHFAGKVKYWITFNEQNLYSQPGATRIAIGIDRDHGETLEEIYRITHNVMYAHAAIANYIHEQTDAKVGGMLAYAEIYPLTANPQDQLLVDQAKEFIDFNLLDCFVAGHYSEAFLQYLHNKKIDLDARDAELQEISRLTSDFLAFSYYQTGVLDSTKVPVGTSPTEYLKYGSVGNPYLRKNEWNWSIDPVGFRKVLNEIYQRYHVPVFPIENGIGLREKWNGKDIIEDDVRIAYHREHILAMKQAIEDDGVKVLGYLGWGLIDILSSSGNMEKRYGVVYVNRTNHELLDMRRVPKKSYYWLKHVIETDGNDL